MLCGGIAQRAIVPLSVEELALGYISVANETMCRAIRGLTQAKGYALDSHALACFGGAGGQHACAVAKSLGVREVFVHRYSGMLSAYGLSLADVIVDLQEPSIMKLSQDNEKEILERFEHLEKRALDQLRVKPLNSSLGSKY